MSALDTLADKAQEASRRFAAQGGIKSKLAGELADDAEFIRKLKPALIKQRFKGNAAANGAPARPEPEPETAPAPAEPEPKGSRGGLHPLVVVGAALVLGVAVAKWIDWRGHAHPRW